MVKTTKQCRNGVKLGAFECKMFEIDSNIYYQWILKHLRPIQRTLTRISSKWSKFSVLYDKSEKSLNLHQIAFIFCRIVSNFFEFDVLLYMQSNPLEFDTIWHNLTAIRRKFNTKLFNLIKIKSSELRRIHIKYCRIVSNFLYFSILHYA
jgi:hypothetical protein